MRIKLPPLDVQIADVIHQLHPLFSLKRGDRPLAAKPSLTLAVPHHVYVLDLKDIVERDDPAPEQPVATRVLEVEEGLNRAVFELAPAGQGQARLRSMSDDASTIDALQRALSEAARIAEKGDGEPELRFIRVPALYVEAFWLHYPDKAHDVVVPVRALGLFEPFRPIAAAQFFAGLREPARERLRTSRDDDFAP